MSLDNHQYQFDYTLNDRKSRILQVQGIKAAAVVVYRKALITQEMGHTGYLTASFLEETYDQR